MMAIFYNRFLAGAKFQVKYVGTAIVLLIFCSLLILIIGCRAQVPVDWPPHVKAKIWVPDYATNVDYYRIAESYQVKYRIKECFPAKSFMKDMVSIMDQRGWRRLNHDLFNPQFRASHIRHPYGDQWDSGRDKDGFDVSQWVDDWRDDKENYITFALK